MKLLLVEDLIEVTDDDGNKIDLTHINRKDPERVMAIVDRIIIERPKIGSFKDTIAESIRNYGFDDANNKLLKFAMDDNAERLENGLSNAFAKVLMRALQDGDVQLDDSFVKKWIWEKWAYDGDISKLRALITASNEKEISKFGDPATREWLIGGEDAEGHKPEFSLKDAKTKADIAQVLDNWQTRDGTGGNARRSKNAETRDENKINRDDTDDVKKSKLFNLFKDLYGLADSDVKTIIGSVYSSGKDLKTLFAEISAALAEKAGLTEVS